MDRVDTQPLKELSVLSPADRVLWLREHGVQEVLHAIGQQLQSLAFSDIGEAIETSEWLTDAADGFGDLPFRCRVLCLRAFVLSVANRFDAAMQTLDEAAVIADRTLDPRSQAGVAQTSVQPLVRLGRYRDAIASAERAISLYNEAGDMTAVARAHSNLGVVHRMLGNPEKALVEFDLALPGMESDRASIAQVQSNRAEALLDLADFHQAERAFCTALESFQHADMARAAAIVAGNLADLLGQQGRLNESLSFFERARATFEEGGADGDAARIESESAEVLATVGLLDEAFAVSTRAAEVLLAHGMRREAARALLVRGVTARRIGDHETATDSLTRAAAFSAELGWRAGVGKANVEAARVAIDGRDFESADQLLDDALRDLTSDSQDRASALLMRSKVFRHVGRRSEAATAVDQALGIAARLGSLPAQAQALHEQALQAEERGELEIAVERCRDALSKVERLRGIIQSDRARSAWGGGHVEIYQDLCAVALRCGGARGLELAFNSVERSKSRSLLELVQAGSRSSDQSVIARGSVTADLIARHQRARGELAALYSWSRFGDGESQSDSARSALRRRADELERELTQLEGRLSAHKEHGAVFSEAIGLDEARSIVPERGVILEYFESRGHIGAFVISAHGATAVGNLCTAEDLTNAVEAARFQVDRGVGIDHSTDRGGRLLARAKVAFQRVHELVFAPIRGALEGVDRCVVVPVGRLHGFPFAALHSGERWLIEDMVVTVAPSVSVIAAMVPAGGPLPRMVRVVGCGDANAPEIEAEAADIAVLYDGDAEVLLGDAATAECVFGGLRRGQLLHLACHGELGGSDPLSARIRLGNRWLTAREIITLDLSGSCVILSCCDVGRGRLQSGDELFGILRSIIAAGASSVVAGFWPAHDAITRDLMKRLHTHLRSNPDSKLSDALANAQRSLLADEPHPSHWATFSAVGADS
jgi:tetratricopeptide (TPR) repeat protein